MENDKKIIKNLVKTLPAFGVYRFTLQAEQPIELPAYAGSAWRGLMGQGLRRTVCVTRQPRCEGCLLIETCACSTIFEARRVPGTAQAPLPYVLVPDLTAAQGLEPGQHFHLEIRLLGAANRHLPYLIHAFQVAGSSGIGKGHGRFRVAHVSQRPSPGAAWQRIYAGEGGLTALPAFAVAEIPSGEPSERVAIELLTPLRVKHHGHLAGRREFDAALWMRHLLWRLESLAAHFGSPGTAADSWRGAHDLVAGLAAADVRLQWRDWTRYSSRQDARMQMGGLLGVFSLAGDALPALWPLIEVGQWTLMGKITSMGLGRYRLRETASLPSRPEISRSVTIQAVGGAG